MPQWPCKDTLRVNRTSRAATDTVKTVNDFPHEVREIENCWIPMPDGCRLAARIWLPRNAESAPVPAVVEYIPYRKRDGTRIRDEMMHAYFAGHGYAAVRIDLRGSGDSDGLLRDEYLEQEHDDGVHALQWIAGQPWCSGAIGMIGKSWGGFNALQIAARQPPELRAIITVCSTDDRYSDDAHYMGGCLLNENVIWGSVLFTLNALPPDPHVVGDRWREMWLRRLENAPLVVENWLRHQRRDDFWKHGSVCEEFDRITCPVYAIGGWADGYSNAVPRLLSGLRAPRKGLVGPWAHLYPHQGVPGPAIGFLQEALRWWDHWLRGVDTGIMEEPVYRVWMQEGVPPRSFYPERPGRWVAEPSWPSPRIRTERLVLEPDRLEWRSGKDSSASQPGSALEISSRLTVGLVGGRWCSFGVEGELPGDQREDDANSLVFDSRALEEKLEILGAPVARLEITADRPVALIAVRLNDVAPDGSSTRVTYGLLNLTHRNSHERLEPLDPGRRHAVTVPLNDVAHVFPAGHRVRLAISTAYWPIAWPAPEPVRLAVFTGASGVELPVRPAWSRDAELRPFERPESAEPSEEVDIHSFGVTRRIDRDRATGETVYTVSVDATETGDIALYRLESIDLEAGHAVEEHFRISETDPLSAEAEIIHRTVSRRGSWQTGITTSTRLTSTRTDFRIEATLEAREGEKLVFERSWDRTVPRDLV